MKSNKKTFISIAMNFANEMTEKNIAAYAASTAYFFFLSFIPLIMLVSTLIPYTNITESDLIEALWQITPDAMNSFISQVVDEAYRLNAGIFSFSIIVTIWAGAIGMLALIRGLNAVINIDEKRNYFYLRFIAAVYTVAMLIILLMLLSGIVFGESIRDIITSTYPVIIPIVKVLLRFKIIVVFVVAVFFLALIYTFVPGRKLKFTFQIPGAMFSAIGCSIFSFAFSMYINYAPGAYSIYGSLTTIIIVMVWLYICFYIILIGAFINDFFHPAMKFLYDGKIAVKKNYHK